MMQATRLPARHAANIAPSRVSHRSNAGVGSVAIQIRGMVAKASKPMHCEYTNEKRKLANSFATGTSCSKARSMNGGTSAMAVSTINTRSRNLQMLSDRPLFISHQNDDVVTIILLAGMATETTALGRGEGLGFEPGLRGLIVGRTGELLVDALEPLLSLLLIAEAAVTVGQSDKQLAARVRAKSA